MSVMASLLESDMLDNDQGNYADYHGSYLSSRNITALLRNAATSARAAPRFPSVRLPLLAAAELALLRNRISALVPCSANLASQTLGMAALDPPNSLGLDLVHPEPVLDPQPTPTSVPSPPPQPTTPPSANATATTTTEVTTPTTDATKIDDAAKPTVTKKSPYVNPDRVKTGGLPRVKLISFSVHIYTIYPSSAL